MPVSVPLIITQVCGGAGGARRRWLAGPRGLGFGFGSLEEAKKNWLVMIDVLYDLDFGFGRAVP